MTASRTQFYLDKQNAKFKGFKPNYNNFMGYVGSLTTPPCTENVQVYTCACTHMCADAHVTHTRVRARTHTCVCVCART